MLRDHFRHCKRLKEFGHMQGKYVKSMLNLYYISSPIFISSELKCFGAISCGAQGLFLDLFSGIISGGMRTTWDAGYQQQDKSPIPSITLALNIF